MEDYKVFEREPEIGEGIQKVYRFPNGYGASVIRLFIRVPDVGMVGVSFGADDGKWELGLIKFMGADNEKYSMVYEHGFDDVVGYLTDSEVDHYLAQIKAIEVSHG